MGQDTKIQWADHTMNFWRGCTRVSEGCDNCYAAAGALRNPGVLGIWGPDGTREIASPAMWRQPARWEEEAIASGVRRRVFCSSIADFFEGPETMPPTAHVPVREARDRAFNVISATPNLDWLLLTKRPQNIVPQYRATMAAAAWRGSMPPNVWAGTSTENQARADERIPHLLGVPAHVRFLSCEPLIGHLDLSRWLATGGIHWVIVGGESGAHSRSFLIDWCEEIVSVCRAFKVACFVKQMGGNVSSDGIRLRLIDKKGGDMDEWPDNLRVRELPAVA